MTLMMMMTMMSPAVEHDRHLGTLSVAAERLQRAVRRPPSHDHTQNIHRKKISEVRSCAWFSRYGSGQTNRHTHCTERRPCQLSERHQLHRTDSSASGAFLISNTVIVDSRLRPRYTPNVVHLLIFIVEQNVVWTDAVVVSALAA